MLRTNLVVGERYILRGINDTPSTSSINCVYEGEGDGRLTLADGATYDAGAHTLKFRVTALDNSVRIVFYNAAADVIEATETRQARERLESERAARVNSARAGALEFLTSLGITDVYVPGREMPYVANHDYQASLLGAAENADELTVSGLTIGDLRRFVGELPQAGQ